MGELSIMNDQLTKIELSVFVYNVLRFMVTKEKSEFKCRFKRSETKVTDKRFTTDVMIEINKNTFRFSSDPKDDICTEVKLVEVSGPITKHEPFDDIIYLLLDHKIVFHDDLYENFFEGIDSDDIIECINHCECGKCNNFVCGLVRCNQCTYDECYDECESEHHDIFDRVLDSIADAIRVIDTGHMVYVYPNKNRDRRNIETVIIRNLY